MTRKALATLVALTCLALTLGVTDRPELPVTRVDAVGFTVGDMDRALAFYTQVLPFSKVSDIEMDGRSFELLSGVFAARARVVRLRLGDETLELTEYRARGRPIPEDFKPNDRAFQHVAVIVSDMDAAYARLRAHRVEHGSSGPQRLPDWNANAGGIKAFYFRDPDRHFLEILQFPPGKGAPKWQSAGGPLFLGIDHTAIVVEDTEATLSLYRDTLGLRVAGESENHDVEQEHLNGVFGARLRITALRAAEGPGIELLEYLAPRNGRPSPGDLSANDVGHWQTTLAATAIDAVLALARAHRLALVSPGPVDLADTGVDGRRAALVRDRDGHGLKLISR
jgi:catechol 2,3-dioxygenase-like lactoylglutathione lyase family enzyme